MLLHPLTDGISPLRHGDMPCRIRAFDWEASALGPTEAWPERLRMAVDLVLSSNSPAIVLWGRALIQIYNDAYRDLMGAKHPGGLGQPTQDCWPEAWHINGPIYDRVWAGETLSFEDKLIPLCRQGVPEDAWFTLSYAPLRAEDGAVAGVLVTVTETTARHRAEAALRESETRAYHLVEGIALAVWEADRAGTIVADSRSWRALTGQSWEEWRGDGWLDAIHPGDRERVSRLWQEAIGSGLPVDAEYRLRVADGGWRWVGARAAPVLDPEGAVQKWVGMSIDVHDRRQAEERLREADERGAFQLALSDALRPLTDPAAIEGAACRLLGAHLGAERVSYTEWDEAADSPRTRDEPIPLTGWCRPTLRAGQPLLVRDARIDARIPEADRAALVAAGVIAFASTPLIRAGRLVGALSVGAARPRDWTEARIGLIQAVAERIWEAVERARTQIRLRVSEERFRGFAEASADVLWIAEVEEERLTYLSPAFERVFGVPREGVMAGASHVAPLIHPEDREIFLSMRPRALTGEEVIAYYRVVRPDGSVVHTRDTAFLIRNEAGDIVQLGGVVQDISDIEVTRAAMEAEKERFRSLAEGIPALVWRASAEGRWTWASPQWLDFTGQTQEGSRGLGWLDAVHPEDRPAAAAAWQVARARDGLDVEFRVRRARDDAYLWHRTRSSPVRDGRGRVVEWLGNTTDIQDLKQLQEQLLHKALHDDLTGLRSRAFLMDRLESLLGQRGARAEKGLALLFLDLDRFKLVNDSLGHPAGDRLLIEVGRRLRVCTRPHDTVARFGGDEFALLIEDADDLDTVVAVTERIIDAMRQPVRLGTQDVYTSCSVGVVYATRAPTTAAEMLRDADIAMYRAKRGGRGGYAVFSEAMRNGAVEALDLRTDLRKAMAQREFSLHYQPICDVSAGTVVGVEALIRWRHPLRGLVSPATFVPAAEESGLIREIGRWILQEACGQLRAWCDRFPGLDLYMNVNTSGVELNDPGYASDVRAALSGAGLDPRKLQIEVTESVFLDQPATVGEMLCRIRALGVRVALDDFGTGYSSLGYLNLYRIDTVKIDRSFVSGLPTRPNAAAIVRAIVGLGQAMELSVVAEGVENETELQALRQAGCTLVQGYLLGRPMPADDIAELLRGAHGAEP